MRCLVTGGAGFIGSHLSEALIAQGHQVRILDDLSSGNLSNLQSFKSRAEFIQASVTDPGRLSPAMKDIDIVFHLAALVSVPDCLQRPEASWLINDRGTFNVYEAAVAAGVKRVVFSSSSAIYGETDYQVAEETPPRPNSPYAIHKLLGEQWGYFCHHYGRLEAVSLRYFNVYGPRQNPGSPYSGVISIFINKLLAGEAVTIYGDGEQTRDFVYVADVAAANIKAAFRPEASGRSFNIATGTSVTLNELYRLLRGCDEKAAGGSKAPVYAPAREGDIKYSAACVKRAREILSFKPDTSLQAGLKLTWDWYCRQPGL